MQKGAPGLCVCVCVFFFGAFGGLGLFGLKFLGSDDSNYHKSHNTKKFSSQTKILILTTIIRRRRILPVKLPKIRIVIPLFESFRTPKRLPECTFVSRKPLNPQTLHPKS